MINGLEKLYAEKCYVKKVNYSFQRNDSKCSIWFPNRQKYEHLFKLERGYEKTYTLQDIWLAQSK